MNSNPLLAAWESPYGLPPFQSIQPAHWGPALEAGMAEHQAEIDRIAGQSAPADFHNTVAALDHGGRLFSRVAMAFENLCLSESSEALQAVEREWNPRIAAHQSRLFLNGALFARIQRVYERRHDSGLDAEQIRLVERYHLDFVQSGACVDPGQKLRFQEIVERLSELCTQFGQNVLADEAGWSLPLNDPAELDGLPASLVDAMAEAARQKGQASGWALTLSRSIYEPFMAHSRRRDLRERLWRAFDRRGMLSPDRDNRPIAAQIIRLRQEQAALLGAANYADHALRDRMARTPAAAGGLLERVWRPAIAQAAKEQALLESLAAAAGQAGPLEAWDWRYWAERVRERDYQLDDAEIKPYFSLERMVEAMFDCAGRLFGLSFEEKSGVELYHPDVRLWEARSRQDGSLVGVFLADNYARPSKRGGAWMSIFREQGRQGAERVPPIVINNNNFAKAPSGQPCLLSFDDVKTLFHEFGHGLHGLLSDTGYERLAGTHVLQDFVELPSQIFENWALELAVLSRHALHAQTKQPIPAELVGRIKAAHSFNQGYLTVQYLGPALIDLALHQAPAGGDLDIEAFEREHCARLGLPATVGLRHRLPHFLHIFAGDDYAAGYYVYLWAEVLAADAFAAFSERGDCFDPELAAKLKTQIYAAGNTRDPAELFRAFRGRDPEVKALLAQRGFPLS